MCGGVGSSHVPAVGAAIDKGRSGEPYWVPFFAQLPPLRAAVAALRPDVCIVVYNDHANAFSLQVIPTFAIGLAPEFPVADEGFGPRPVPAVVGHPELAWHLAETLILDEFDLTLVNEMPVDHGLTVPLSLMFGEVAAWPCPVVPFCVNVVQYPPPTGHRCFMLGQAIRRAVESYPGSERVLVVGTGGLSHQLQAQRAGLVNPEFDERFLDLVVGEPEAAAAYQARRVPPRGRLGGHRDGDVVGDRGALTATVRPTYRSTHLPTSNTHHGLLVLEPA